MQGFCYYILHLKSLPWPYAIVTPPIRGSMVGHKPSQHGSDCCHAIILSNQTESQIAWRLTDRATAPSRVSNEVRHKGAVFAFDGPRNWRSERQPTCPLHQVIAE